MAEMAILLKSACEFSAISIKSSTNVSWILKDNPKMCLDGKAKICQADFKKKKKIRGGGSSTRYQGLPSK